MDKIYKISQMAKMLNVSVKTLQRWDNANIFKAHRTPGNHRFYTHKQYCKYMDGSLGICNDKSLQDRD